jgi:hypothetical protein
LPLFKEKNQTYDAGQPSQSLYIKNLYKDAKKSDLEYIFGRFFDTDEEMNRFDIYCDLMLIM